MIMWLKPFSDSLCRMRVRLPVHIPDKSPSELAVRRLDGGSGDSKRFRQCECQNRTDEVPPDKRVTIRLTIALPR